MSTASIFAIPALKDNYIWAIVTKERNAIIVDPGEAEPVLTFLKQNQLHLKGILITHHHFDHTNGIADILALHPTPVFGPANENISGMTHPVNANDNILIETCPIPFRVIAIPGHTLGHVAYFTPGSLFCGDTLFAGGCGRIFEGTAEQMYASLQTIAALPDSTNLYCGHEYTLKNLQFAELVEPNNPFIAERMKAVNELRTKNQPSLPSLLSDEKKTNPFLRCQYPEVIASAEKHAGYKLEKEVDVFARIRHWKDAL